MPTLAPGTYKLRAMTKDAQGNYSTATNGATATLLSRGAATNADGSVFTGRYRWLDRVKGEIAPTITGTAHVTAEATLLLDPRDLFCWGIGPQT